MLSGRSEYDNLSQFVPTNRPRPPAQMDFRLYLEYRRRLFAKCLHARQAPCSHPVFYRAATMAAGVSRVSATDSPAVIAAMLYQAIRWHIHVIASVTIQEMSLHRRS